MELRSLQSIREFPAFSTMETSIDKGQNGTQMRIKSILLLFVDRSHTAPPTHTHTTNIVGDDESAFNIGRESFIQIPNVVVVNDFLSSPAIIRQKWGA